LAFIFASFRLKDNTYQRNGKSGEKAKREKHNSLGLSQSVHKGRIISKLPFWSACKTYSPLTDGLSALPYCFLVPLGNSYFLSIFSGDNHLLIDIAKIPIKRNTKVVIPTPKRISFVSSDMVILWASLCHAFYQVHFLPEREENGVQTWSDHPHPYSPSPSEKTVP
jgi:hypothetical protein